MTITFLVLTTLTAHRQCLNHLSLYLGYTFFPSRRENQASLSPTLIGSITQISAILDTKPIRITSSEWPSFISFGTNRNTA
ncbi:hypothetical protein GGR57DRAFT_486265 [Xylariaceae sp. FL1272]|nr:hypothetical protein GGR57DRAFT_486265 [Xylariaceae sp. FL1272]